MQPNHKFSNRRTVRVGDSEEENEEEAKLHERENELKILQEILEILAHPTMFDSHNLYKQTSSSKLTKFSMHVAAARHMQLV